MNAELVPGLYIVATPIGNLGDLSARAAHVLSHADVIAVEDSRVTAGLLRHIGVKRPMTPYHDHNADTVRPGLIARMGGEVVALVSDAGTPLISDPGYKLVRDARAAGHTVVTVPGPCAAVAALTLAGLPTDRFLFAGFLPSKDKARGDVLAELAAIPATLVFYETGPRLVASLEAMARVMPGREIAVARELTKLHEECRTGSAEELVEHYSAHRPKGEIVLLAGPPGAPEKPGEADVDAELLAAVAEMPASKAAGLVAKKHGLDRKTLYARLMELKG